MDIQHNTTLGRCRLCGHEGLSLLRRQTTLLFKEESSETAEEILEYVGCPNCGLIQIVPPPSRERIGAYYKSAPSAGLNHSVLDTVKKSYYTSTIQFLRKHFALDPPKRIFETGAHSGYLLHLLSGTFEASVTGIEPSDEARRWALKEYGIHLFPGILEELDLDKLEIRNAFDLNICCSVLEHVPSPPKMMTHLADSVKQGGHVYLEVPSLSPGMLNAPSERVIQRLHLCYYTPHTLFRLGVKAGLLTLHLEEERNLEVPVYRVLYRKQPPLSYSSDLFRQHAHSFEEQFASALQTCIKIIGSGKNVWLWGIGDDFYALWSCAANIFAADNCHLVDNNKAKKGKHLGQKVVAAPDPAICGRPEFILVSPSSRLIQESIVREAKNKFPETDLILLFNKEYS